MRWDTEIISCPVLKNAVKLNQHFFKKYKNYEDILSKVKVLEIKKIFQFAGVWL